MTETDVKTERCTIKAEPNGWNFPPSGEKENKDAYKPLSGRFQVILKSNAIQPESFLDVHLDLFDGLLTTHIVENNEFAVLDWITKIPKDEVITLVTDDPDGKILCMLRLCEISIEGHNVAFFRNSPNSKFGIDTPDAPVTHLVKLKYRKFDRCPNPKT